MSLKVVKPWLKWSDISKIGADKLLEKIAKEHSILYPKSILEKTRNPRIVIARDHFLALLRWSTDLSYPEIGHILKMDHTAVMYAVERHERLLNGETRYDQEKRRAQNARWASK